MIYTSYMNSFRGLSREIWWLALITFINRAGTMVIPFLSLYLTQDLGFTLENVGIIMTCFGIGSLIGSWVGGKLTDVFGYYKVMLISLLLTGLLFFPASQNFTEEMTKKLLPEKSSFLFFQALKNDCSR